jgi:hypothetical protein
MSHQKKMKQPRLHQREAKPAWVRNAERFGRLSAWRPFNLGTWVDATNRAGAEAEKRRKIYVSAVIQHFYAGLIYPFRVKESLRYAVPAFSNALESTSHQTLAHQIRPMNNILKKVLAVFIVAAVAAPAVSYAKPQSSQVHEGQARCSLSGIRARLIKIQSGAMPA